MQKYLYVVKETDTGNALKEIFDALDIMYIRREDSIQACYLDGTNMNEAVEAQLNIKGWKLA